MVLFGTIANRWKGSLFEKLMKERKGAGSRQRWNELAVPFCGNIRAWTANAERLRSVLSRAKRDTLSINTPAEHRKVCRLDFRGVVFVVSLIIHLKISDSPPKRLYYFFFRFSQKQQSTVRLRYTKTLNHQIALTVTERAVDSNKNSLMELSFQDWLLHQGFKVYSESTSRHPEALSFNDLLQKHNRKKNVINNTIPKTKILAIPCSQKYRTTPMLVAPWACTEHRRSY